MSNEAVAAWKNRCLEERAKVARAVARLDEESPCLDRYLGAASCDHPGCVLERDIRGILADPEDQP